MILRLVAYFAWTIKFNLVEEMAYHSLHQNKNKCQNIVRGCRETGKPSWISEISVLPTIALVEETERTEKFVGSLEQRSFTEAQEQTALQEQCVCHLSDMTKGVDRLHREWAAVEEGKPLSRLEGK